MAATCLLLIEVLHRQFLANRNLHAIEKHIPPNVLLPCASIVDKSNIHLFPAECG